MQYVVKLSRLQGKKRTPCGVDQRGIQILLPICRFCGSIPGLACRIFSNGTRSLREIRYKVSPSSTIQNIPLSHGCFKGFFLLIMPSCNYYYYILWNMADEGDKIELMGGETFAFGLVRYAINLGFCSGRMGICIIW